MKAASTFLWCLVLLTAIVPVAQGAANGEPGANEPGILEPNTSFIQGREVRVPNTDQSVDGVEQTNAKNVVFEDAFDGTVQSITGNTITHVNSPNADMRNALKAIVTAAADGNQADMEAHAEDLRNILLGTTDGRIYDGFNMLNWNRFKPTAFGNVGPESMPPGLDDGEYKMKTARLTGDTFTSPFDGEERQIWETDINFLYYDGQIDSDTFLVKFPIGHHGDDVLHVNYRIFSLVEEDFSPTLVMLDKRMTPRTVSFPFKGFDAVWIAFFPGEVLNVRVTYPPIRMIRGVYNWGWRVHPPRIQFMQPVYEIINGHTGEVELDAQGQSFAYRNREDLTIDAIAAQAPEKKMYELVKAILLDGASPADVEAWMTLDAVGPRGTWVDWADLVTEMRQLSDEAWELVAEEDGLGVGEFGDYQMLTVMMNNEMYGEGPAQDEIKTWQQGELFKVKLINFDNHTHYFRNVDFGARLHDDILRCCGGGETSFEIMNFKPSYGAPKVAEMQWRAGWGFRPHYDVIQQQGVFSRGQDRVKVAPYTDGANRHHYGYQYSEEFRGGDFRFNPPPFIILEANNPAQFPLRDGTDGLPGLLIGQKTEGYGTAQFCPNDPFPGFCTTDIAAYNNLGVVNFPPPPLRGAPVFPVDVGKFPGDVYPDRAVELRFPPFLRNPSQGDAAAGDIIPPTNVWRPFLWVSPNNGTIFNNGVDKSDGYWADLTMGHGAPVFANSSLTANVELPRASGQVFYQFDDLFHDNMIFSPHPVFAGFEEEAERDEFTHLRAFKTPGGSVKVRGRLASGSLTGGQISNWVALHEGGVVDGVCAGPVIADAAVNVIQGGRADGQGLFSFRCGSECFAATKAAVLEPGDTICVQTPVGTAYSTDVQ